MGRRNNTKDNKDKKDKREKKYHEEKVITHVREDVVAKRKRKQRNFTYYILSVLVTAIIIPMLKRYTNDPSMMVYLTVSLPLILIMFISFNFRKDHEILSYSTLIYLITVILSYRITMKLNIMPFSMHVLKLFVLYAIIGYFAGDLYTRIAKNYIRKEKVKKKEK